MNSNALLTKQLEASITIEVNKKQLLRAACILTIAQKAFKRYTEWEMNALGYEIAAGRGEPWTLVNSREQTIKRATDAHAAHARLMKAYRRILFRLFTKQK